MGLGVSFAPPPNSQAVARASQPSSFCNHEGPFYKKLETILNKDTVKPNHDALIFQGKKPLQHLQVCRHLPQDISCTGRKMFVLLELTYGFESRGRWIVPQLKTLLLHALKEAEPQKYKKLLPFFSSFYTIPIPPNSILLSGLENWIGSISILGQEFQDRPWPHFKRWWATQTYLPLPLQKIVCLYLLGPEHVCNPLYAWDLLEHKC